MTLEVKPADSLALETAIAMLNESVVAELTEEGIPDGVRFSLSGTADKLTQTQQALQVNLLIALVIVYLVMAILFESFVLPFVILLSVPVAAAGGVAGLVAINMYQTQPLDMLTMLGFVISDRDCRQQCDPHCSPDFASSPRGRHVGAGCDRRGDRQSYSSDLHVNTDQHISACCRWSCFQARARNCTGGSGRSSSAA